MRDILRAIVGLCALGMFADLFEQIKQAVNELRLKHLNCQPIAMMAKNLRRELGRPSHRLHERDIEHLSSQ